MTAGQPVPPAEAPPDPDVLTTPAAGPAAVRGGFMRGAGFLLGAGASVLTASLLFRHLGVVDLGHYVTILSLVTIVAGLSDLGLTAVGVREASVASRHQRGELLRDLLGLRLSLTLLGVAVMCAVAAIAYPDFYIAGVAIAGAGLLLQVTQDNYSVLLTVNLRLGWVATLDALRQVSTLAFVALLVLADAHLLAFVAVTVAAGAVCLAVVALLMRGQRGLSPTFHLASWKRMVAEVLPYSIAVAASAVYFRVAIVLLSLISTGHQLGYFSAAFRAIEFLTVIPALLAGSALPIFSRAASDDLNRLGYGLGRVFEVALIVGAWFAVSIAVVASLAMSILGGHGYGPATPVLRILGVALAGTFISLVWSNALLSLRRHRALLVISVGTLIGATALITVLISADGARGAAIGLACGEFAAAIAAAVALTRLNPALEPPLKVVPKVILASALALTPMLLTGVPVIVRGAISTAIYAAVLLATRAFPAELADLWSGLPWPGRAR